MLKPVGGVDLKLSPSELEQLAWAMEVEEDLAKPGYYGPKGRR